MARKRIQKAPKGNKADSDEDHNDQTPQQDEPAQEPVADEPEPEPAVKTKAPKKTKGAAKQKESNGNNQSKPSGQAAQVQLFSEEFIQHIDSFKSFYQEFLELKASTGDNDKGDELSKVTQATRGKIESACLAVLREDVGDAEKWVGSQQQAIRDQITSVEKAQREMRASLEATKTFSAGEIDQQVDGIRRKKQTLEQSLARLEEIKTRANQIYQHSSSAGSHIDEQ